jgi:hypothetical protein
MPRRPVNKVTIEKTAALEALPQPPLKKNSRKEKRFASDKVRVGTSRTTEPRLKSVLGLVTTFINYITPLIFKAYSSFFSLIKLAAATSLASLMKAMRVMTPTILRPKLMKQ